MTKMNVRGILFSLLIGAVMAAGVILAAPSKATPQQDTQFYRLLEDQGMIVTDKVKARSTAWTICDALDAAVPWQAVVTALMDGGSWDLDSAATVFATSVFVYCPNLAPSFDEKAGSLA